MNKSVRLAWEQYEAGKEYKRRIGLYETIRENESFYRGQQWRDGECAELPRPVFNVVRRIIDYLVCSVAASNLSIRFTDENLPYIHNEAERKRMQKSLDILSKMFGEDVAMLVDGLTKIIQVKIEDKEEAHIENIRKMLLAMNKDIRVIFIKLCDRLHNMRTLGAKKEDRQRAIALETMYIYAPLAHRLGIQRIKQELENISLYYLDRVGYDEVHS